MAELTVAILKRRVLEGAYESKTKALRALGGSSLSKKDKREAKEFIEKKMSTPTLAPTIHATSDEYMRKLNDCRYPSVGNAMAVISRLSMGEAPKNRLRRAVRDFFETPKGKKLQRSVYDKQQFTRRKNYAESNEPKSTPKKRRYESKSAPEEFVRVLLDLDEKRLRETLVLLSGAADFGFTLPGLISTLERKKKVA